MDILRHRNRDHAVDPCHARNMLPYPRTYAHHRVDFSGLTLGLRIFQGDVRPTEHLMNTLDRNRLRPQRMPQCWMAPRTAYADQRPLSSSNVRGPRPWAMTSQRSSASKSSRRREGHGVNFGCPPCVSCALRLRRGSRRPLLGSAAPTREVPAIRGVLAPRCGQRSGQRSGQ